MRRIVIVFSFLIFAWTVGAAETSPLVLTFTNTTVTLQGITPRARAIFFYVSREPRRYYSIVNRRMEFVDDTDGRGQVSWNVPGGIPHRAIWAVVDLASGNYIVQPTAGYDNAPIVLATDALKADHNGQLRKFEFPLTEAQVFWARPSEGAWWALVGKDSIADENRDAANGIRLDISRMQPIGNSPDAPNSFKKGDILVAIDPRWMMYGFLEVGK